MDSDGLGKTLVYIQHEGSIYESAVSPALGKRLLLRQDGVCADERRVSPTAHSPDDGFAQQERIQR